MSVIITGANGFVGQNLAEYLICNGKNVICVHRRARPALSINPDESSGTMAIKQADLSDRAQCDMLFGDGSADAVVHLAGQMRGKRIKDYLENSVRATENMIASAEKHGVPTFILVSSIAVYGYVGGVVNESSDKVNPDDYAIAKIICERLLEDSRIPNRIVLRLPRILGKGLDLSYPWIPKLTAKLLKNETVEYFNPELLYNNMAYVNTVSEFIQKLICERKSGCMVYGLGAADSRPVKYIIEKLKRLFNSESILKETHKEVRNTCHQIDISKAIEAGYKALSVDETLERFAIDIIG